MDRQELEDRLSTLVHDAQQQPVGSWERKLALNDLTQEIYKQRFIIIPRSALEKYPNLLREEIFNTAVQKFMLYLVEENIKIEKYNPDRGTVIQWIQIRFVKIGGFFDKAYAEICSKPQKIKVNLILEELEDENIDIWQDIEETPGQELKRIIEEDKDGIFSNEKMKHTPQVNWRDLALKRIEQTWKEIAADYQELGVTPTGLSRFFFYRMKKEPLKSILANYGVRNERNRNNQ